MGGVDQGIAGTTALEFDELQRVLGGSLKRTLAAMATVARAGGLLDYEVVLGSEDFARLATELEPFGLDPLKAVTAGALQLITCNGVQDVRATNLEIREDEPDDAATSAMYFDLVGTGGGNGQQ